MRGSTAVTAALLLFTALVVQLAVLSRLPLPYATPDLVVVVLVSCAVSEGPLAGLVLGFGTGLVADLASDHQVGRLALIFTLVGYAVGSLRDDSRTSTLVPLAAVGAATAAVVGLTALTGVLLGDPRVSDADIVRSAAASILYDLLLTPFVFPLVSGLLRRLDPERAERWR